VEQKLNFVVVEDIKHDVELIAWNLIRGGVNCELHRVDTEPALIAAIQSIKPDVILADCTLPKFDGMRALEIARNHAPDTPFIFVSGTIGEERAIEALRRGAIDYVLKSNLVRLATAVERALREAALKATKRRAEQQLRRLTRAYRMLSSTSSATLRLRDRIDLLDEACRIAVQQGGYDRVAIALIDPGQTTVRWYAHSGVDDPTPWDLERTEFSAKDHTALLERVIQSGAPFIHNDAGSVSQPPPRRESSIGEGYPAVAAFPLLVDGTVIGVMTLLSRQRDVFDEGEVRVLRELTANLSFALQYLEKDEAVHFLSYFDSLTGLAKRPLFCERLARLIGAESESARTMTLVAFDVQKLGAINDSFGRYVGDRLIENIAARLKRHYQDLDCLAHLGGGTFAVMLRSNGSAGDTARLSQNAVGFLFSEPFVIDGQEFRVLIRCGVALYPHDAETADALVQNAEAALRVARQDNEKDMLYALVTQRSNTISVTLEARLAGALERGEFLLHYQPKIDLTNGRIAGFEALLRWRDAQDGLVPPSTFIPLLERSGAIIDVGEWVLLKAVADVRAWGAAGVNPVRVAVNVSPLQLRRRDFVERVLRATEPLTQQPSGIDVEITESMLMQDIDLSIGKLARLREAGVGVAIDDFGTGYSSLRLLAKLPVNTLKIDRSFVQSMGNSQSDLTLVCTVASLARAFNMQTVAEGVETAQQLHLLQQIRCDQGQGYLFARPVPAADVPSLIAHLSPAVTLGERGWDPPTSVATAAAR
jgi:diguanylate cyclase (GGDEF)-like protein